MKKQLFSGSLLLMALLLVAGTSYALPGNSGRDGGKEFMMRGRETTPGLSPTGLSGTPAETENRGMACAQAKIILPKRSDLLKLRKEVHLKVYENLRTNIKRRLMARGLTETAINDALAGFDKLVTQFSTDVDAEIAKMAAAATLDCTNTTALTTFRQDLRTLEKTVKSDVEAIMNYYKTTLKNMGRGGRRADEPTKAPSVTIVPSVTTAPSITVVPTL